MQVVAIRVNPSRRCGPDYRGDVIEGCYQMNEFNTVLGVMLEELDYVAGELSGLLGNDELSIVELENGPYMVCMLPSSFRRRAD